MTMCFDVCLSRPEHSRSCQVMTSLNDVTFYFRLSFVCSQQMKMIVRAFYCVLSSIVEFVYMARHRLNMEQSKKFDRTFLSSLNFDDAGIELTRLTSIYRQLCEHNHHEYLTREYFRDFLSAVFDMNDETIVERLFILIGQGEKTFSLKQFLSTMNILLYARTNEQIAFIFRIYDVSADGNLQREELFAFLRQDLPIINEKDDVDMILHEFIGLVFKKFDKDHDGVISYDDFSRTCEENPTLRQCFGQVLPRFFRQHVIKAMLNGHVS
jgi:Ca2+-binding EF-hand superfamily protein